MADSIPLPASRPNFESIARITLDQDARLFAVGVYWPTRVPGNLDFELRQPDGSPGIPISHRVERDAATLEIDLHELVGPDGATWAVWFSVGELSWQRVDASIEDPGDSIRCARATASWFQS